MVLVLVLEGVAGVIAYVYEEQLLHLLTESLPTTVSEQYYVREDVTLAVDDMQTQVSTEISRSYTRPNGHLVEIKNKYFNTCTIPNLTLLNVTKQSYIYSDQCPSGHDVTSM